MFIHQFRKEGVGEKAMSIVRDFFKYRNRCHLTWQSYEHLWLVCYGHIIFRHKRCTICTRLLHISIEHLILCKIYLQCILGWQLPVIFSYFKQNILLLKISIFVGLISNNPSCGTSVFTGLSAGNGYKHRFCSVGVILLSDLKRSLVSSALAELQQILQWLTTEPGKWEEVCCNIKWELPGDESSHWPTTESGMVPLSIWNNWEFIAIQTELSAKPWQFSSIENEIFGGLMW